MSFPLWTRTAESVRYEVHSVHAGDDGQWLVPVRVIGMSGFVVLFWPDENAISGWPPGHPRDLKESLEEWLAIVHDNMSKR